MFIIRPWLRKREWVFENVECLKPGGRPTPPISRTHAPTVGHGCRCRPPRPPTRRRCHLCLLLLLLLVGAPKGEEGPAGLEGRGGMERLHRLLHLRL